MQGKLKETADYYEESTRLLIEACSSGSGGTAKVMQIVQGRFGAAGDLRGLAGLQPLLSDIKASLRKELLVPVMTALAAKTPSRELLHGFNGRPEALEGLRSAYERLKILGYRNPCSYRSEEGVQEERDLYVDDQESIDGFKEMQQAMAGLFLALRRLMTGTGRGDAPRPGTTRGYRHRPPRAQLGGQLVASRRG